MQRYESENKGERFASSGRTAFCFLGKTKSPLRQISVLLPKWDDFGRFTGYSPDL